MAPKAASQPAQRARSTRPRPRPLDIARLELGKTDPSTTSIASSAKLCACAERVAAIAVNLEASPYLFESLVHQATTSDHCTRANHRLHTPESSTLPPTWSVRSPDARSFGRRVSELLLLESASHSARSCLAGYYAASCHSPPPTKPVCTRLIEYLMQACSARTTTWSSPPGRR